jgi:hypothetical protein
MIPVLEREKTFHTVDRAATVIGPAEISNRQGYIFLRLSSLFTSLLFVATLPLSSVPFFPDAGGKAAGA